MAKIQVDVVETLSGNALARAIQEITGLETAAGKGASGVNVLRSAFGNLTPAIGIAEQAIGALGISLSAAGIASIAQIGAEVQETTGIFKTLSTQAGQSSGQLLAALREASEGTVSNTQLMQASIKMYLTGLNLSVEQSAKLMEIAKARGSAMGMGASEAFTALTTAIEYQQSRMLRQLGIVIDSSKAMKDYADANHVAVASMTEAQQQQAMLNAVLAATAGTTGDLSGGMDKAAESIERAKAAAQNLVDLLGTKLAPAFGTAASAAASFLDTVGAGIEKTFPSQEAALKAHLMAVSKEYENAQRKQQELLDYNANVPESSRLPIAPIDPKLEAEFKAAQDAYNAFYNTQKENNQALVEGAAAQAALANASKQTDIEAVRLNNTLSQQHALLIADAKAAEDYAAANKKVSDSIKETLKSMISQAATPTSVTDADMQATAQGTYKNKWDESARRFDAIATGTDPSKYGADFARMFASMGMSADEAAAKFRDFSLFADPKNLGLVDWGAMAGDVGGQIDAMVGKFNFMQEGVGKVWENLPKERKDALAKLGIMNADDMTKKMLGFNDLSMGVAKSGDFDVTLKSIQDSITSSIPKEMSTVVFVTYKTAPTDSGDGSGGGNSDAWGGTGEKQAAGGFGIARQGQTFTADAGEGYWFSGKNWQVPPPSAAGEQHFHLYLDGAPISAKVVKDIARRR